LAASLLSEEAIIEKILQAEEKERAASREGRAWRLILQGRRMLEGEQAKVPATQDGRKPGTSEAIERVMASQPEREWTISEIVAQLAENGWSPDSKDAANAVAASLSGLFQAKRVSRPNRGVYQISPQAMGEYQQQLLDEERG
jgi:hypothetical protein